MQDAIETTNGPKWTTAFSICKCISIFILMSIAISSHPPSAHGQSLWPNQVRSTPFHFHSDAPLRDIDSIIAEIQTLPKQLQATLAIQPRVELIHIVVMDTDETFQRYMQHYFPQAPARRALFIKDRGPGIVFAYRNTEMLVDLRHECTHALLHDRLPSLPLWMDEGIAEFFEVKADSNYYHPSHAEAIRWQTRLGHVPNIADLEKLDDVANMSSDDYRDAWAWIHFLMNNNSVSRESLLSYLRDMERGHTAGLFSHRMQRAIPNWRDAFIEYFQRLSPAQGSTMQVSFKKTDESQAR
jgi:Protein of unknown function (DUF1570)